MPQPPSGKRKRNEDDSPERPDDARKKRQKKKRQTTLDDAFGFGNTWVHDDSDKPNAPADDDDSETTSSADGGTTTISLLEYLLEAKKKMQRKGSKNGVTFALIGSSGCGKSTLLKTIFVDGMYSDDAQKVISKEERQRFVVAFFTESEHSDALDHMPKDIVMFPRGIDVHTINWAYRTNARYDKQYNFVLLSDDCIHLRHVKMVEKMFLTMRNSNLTSVVSVQYPKLIPLSVRTSVYFTLLFLFNNEEGIEQVVRGWLARFLPGQNVREKMDSYAAWCMGADGHRFFLMDNLSHKCFRVDENYQMVELKPQSFMEYRMRGPASSSSLKRNRDEDPIEATTTTSSLPPAKKPWREEDEERQDA